MVDEDWFQFWEEKCWGHLQGHKDTNYSWPGTHHCFLFDYEMILEQPDVDRYADAFCGQQAGDDAETKAVADVGEDDHGHGDEVEVGDQVEGEDIGMAELRKYSNREEGEANYDCCREEDPFPENTFDRSEDFDFRH